MNTDDAARIWGAEADEKVVENNLAILTAKLQGYEAILSQWKYLAGDVGRFECCLQTFAVNPAAGHDSC